jgi:hypothetical protein
MASFNKINDFVEDLAEGVHDLGSDQIAVALSNTAPGAEGSDPTGDGNGDLGNVSEVGYGNLSGANPRNVTTTSSTQSGGTYQLTLTDLTLTASGGSVGAFRYVYIYNEDAASDELICYYDYGSSITLADGETLDIDFDNANGLFQLS